MTNHTVSKLQPLPCNENQFQNRVSKSSHFRRVSIYQKPPLDLPTQIFGQYRDFFIPQLTFKPPLKSPYLAGVSPTDLSLTRRTSVTNNNNNNEGSIAPIIQVSKLKRKLKPSKPLKKSSLPFIVTDVKPKTRKVASNSSASDTNEVSKTEKSKKTSPPPKKKIYLSDGINRVNKGMLGVPPATPELCYLETVEYIDCLTDIKGKRKLGTMLTALAKRQEEVKLKQIEVQKKEQEIERKKKMASLRVQQRNKIYALNKIMQALEESRFIDFIESTKNNANNVLDVDNESPEVCKCDTKNEFEKINFGGV